jgi:hypothetical protein
LALNDFYGFIRVCLLASEPGVLYIAAKTQKGK